MATTKKSSTKKTVVKAKTTTAKRERAAASAEARSEYTTGVRLGIISLTMLALAFLLLVLTRYQ